MSAPPVIAVPLPRRRQAPARDVTPAAPTATTPTTGADGRPLLRGWLHAGFAPVALVIGLWLLADADGPLELSATAVFAATGLAVFTTSGLYHRVPWSRAGMLRVRRLDHALIPLAVAAGATPLALLGLPRATGHPLVAVVWVAALATAASRWVWPGCPRRVHAAVTVALGWVTVPLLPALAAHSGTGVAALVGAAGALLTLGALAYAVGRPNPWPRWFAHHEVFHALTVLAWPLHAAAVHLLLR